MLARTPTRTQYSIAAELHLSLRFIARFVNCICVNISIKRITTHLLCKSIEIQLNSITYSSRFDSFAFTWFPFCFYFDFILPYSKFLLQMHCVPFWILSDLDSDTRLNNWQLNNSHCPLCPVVIVSQRIIFLKWHLAKFSCFVSISLSLLKETLKKMMINHLKYWFTIIDSCCLQIVDQSNQREGSI